MSQRDLSAELRAARVSAPDELRQRVRLIATEDTAPRASRFTWRRFLVVAVPAAAAIAGALLVIHPGQQKQTTQRTLGKAGHVQPDDAKVFTQGAAVGGGAATKLAPQASTTRVQRYGASIALRLANANDVSNAVKRALRVASSLGGYPTAVHASSSGNAATADLVLRVPRTHVQEAISRLSALGTITGEQVEIQDVQAGLDTTSRTIARLQRQLKSLRAQQQTASVKADIATITARVARLQRQEAAAIRSARLATIQLHLATKERVVVHHAHGPLHGLGVAFHWLWIGAIYAAALGLPLLVLLALIWLAVRTVRRRREDALLSRP